MFILFIVYNFVSCFCFISCFNWEQAAVLPVCSAPCVTSLMVIYLFPQSESVSLCVSVKVATARRPCLPLAYIIKCQQLVLKGELIFIHVVNAEVKPEEGGDETQ